MSFSLLPCEPLYCWIDPMPVPFSDWPVPSGSWLHLRTSQSAAEEAPQCPVLIEPRSTKHTKNWTESGKRTSYFVVLSHFILHSRSDGSAVTQQRLLKSECCCIKVFASLLSSLDRGCVWKLETDPWTRHCKLWLHMGWKPKPSHLSVSLLVCLCDPDPCSARAPA